MGDFFSRDDPLVEVIQAVFGPLLLIMGISVALHAERWEEVAKKLVEAKTVIFIFSFFTLLLGLFIITSHPIWGWKKEVIITMFGWLMTIKSAGFFLAPQILDSSLVKKFKYVFLVSMCWLNLFHYRIVIRH